MLDISWERLSSLKTLDWRHKGDELVVAFQLYFFACFLQVHIFFHAQLASNSGVARAKLTSSLSILHISWMWIFICWFCLLFLAWLGLAGPVGNPAPPAQINAWNGLALKIHFKACANSLVMQKRGWHAVRSQGRVVIACLYLLHGYAEGGESNHTVLCCYLTLRFPLRITFLAVWPS